MQINSRRLRNPEESTVLKNWGDRIVIYELQGELTFTATEVVIRDVAQAYEATEFAIVDMKRVVAANDAAWKLLIDLRQRLIAKNVTLFFTNIDNNLPFQTLEEQASDAPTLQTCMIFDDNDLALEWCENRLLERRMQRSSPQERMTCAEG